jgi:CDP-paratose 2-epimerase
MDIVLVTASAGLVSSESVRFFCERGLTVVGIDNNMRRHFFGEDASTDWNLNLLFQDYGENYIHHNGDIRNQEDITKIFNTYGQDISLIIHAAAQPSHDWADWDPRTIDANGSLNVLQSTRKQCPEATFIFFSRNV